MIQEACNIHLIKIHNYKTISQSKVTEKTHLVDLGFWV